jgi:hypothetical protein
MWEQSKCGNGLWLHDWLILRQWPDGLEEYCYKCGKTEFFRNNTPNDIYLNSHLRMALKPYMPEYDIEYQKI